MANTYKLKTFRTTIAVLNTAQVLSTATTAAQGRFAQAAVLHVPSANTAIVYIGDSTVSATTGFPLVAGSTISLSDLFKGNRVREWDLASIYVYGAANDVVRVAHELEQ